MPKMAKYKENLLDEFEQKSGDWTFGDFENRLGQVRKGASYKDAKGIILDAHNSGKWPNTVKRYILTNYKSFGNVSSELNDVLNGVWSQLSDQEKKLWASS